MFQGVVATGDHAWTPNQGLNHDNDTEDSEHIDMGSESFEDPSQNLESINDCSQLKRPSSTTSTSRRKRKFGSTFLRSQITQLVNSCTNITSGISASKSVTDTPSLSTAIKVLEETTKAFEDMPLYLFSTKLLEDPTKREHGISYPADVGQLIRNIKAPKSLNIMSGLECNENLIESADIANIKKIILTAICVIYEYYETYICKTPCLTSSSRGDKWIGELLHGHPMRFHNMFHMSQTIFLDLLYELECVHHLHGSSRTISREVLAMSLYILSHNESIRSTCERFQHSSETISMYFSIGLEALVKFSCSVIKPIDPQFGDIPRNILYDHRYMPYFKDCIGAIDGTHVDARVSNAEKAAYIGRCGSTTQNVMAVCDFNMCFTFIMAGCNRICT
ncbi:uncharacterized protein LOC114581025 [Dendrobium catenatum]|uniref:uncharacterized protein LOC114581025 n=1 Tax=Dendrobium catenatum TaxID=906689 RepID=UPI00109FF3C3|nr:uncharacterized protein LOC114581025 [Dendrobium catenatum]